MLDKGCPDLKIKVMVRAWGDEPVPLFLYSIENKRAYVGKQDGTKVIGLPLDQVYLFDDGAFSGLQQAFKAASWSKLSSMYREISVKSICNRYQDVLKSLNDKENITDSRSVAESSER